MDLGFPPVFEVGKHERSHDDASKKVTAPTGVAVVSITQGFRPAPSPTPRPSGTRRKETPLGYRQGEASRTLSSAEHEALTGSPPPPLLDGAGRWRSSPPPRRREHGPALAPPWCLAAATARRRHASASTVSAPQARPWRIRSCRRFCRAYPPGSRPLATSSRRGRRQEPQHRAAARSRRRTMLQTRG